ncbi:MAG TPA: hypothetical protein VMF08_18445 [Candidatus Sulfotelmatobacter sp.]|nr:hypothetical protein [Candidatus Sulfotelmatobacter sp.]
MKTEKQALPVTIMHDSGARDKCGPAHGVSECSSDKYNDARKRPVYNGIGIPPPSSSVGA